MFFLYTIRSKECGQLTLIITLICVCLNIMSINKVPEDIFGLKKLAWPEQSPDLKPTEHL